LAFSRPLCSGAGRCGNVGSLAAALICRVASARH